MVIAKTKLMIHDDILKPRAQISLDFKGREPDRFYYEVPEILASIFKVHVGQIQEKKMSWTKGDPQKFSVEWELDKDLDKFTYYMLEIALKGTESKGTGAAAITIKAHLRTEYPQDTFWEKSLLYEFLRMTWHKMFYESQRESWIKEGRQLVALFVEDLKRLTHA